MLRADPEFQNYGFLIEPGTYALTEVEIKAARGIADVVSLVADRGTLMDEGMPLGGTLRVRPSEIVYVGNFFLDCADGPVIWRYYTEAGEDFEDHASEYKRKFHFLQEREIEYRLFETSVFGQPYELPRSPD